MRRLELGLTAVGVVVLFLYLHFDLFGDGLVRFQTLDALLGHGTFLQEKYSLVGPLFSSPLWLLGQVWKGAAWWCARYNFILFLLALVTWVRLPETWVPGPIKTRFALILVAASMFPSFHLEAYYGEVFSTLTAGFGLLALAHDRPRVAVPLLALSAANIPATLPALFLAALVHGWNTHRWHALLAVPAAVAVVGLEGALHGGWQLYSSEAATRTPFPVGFLSLTVSMGKGILFFAPGLWLARSSLVDSLPARLAATCRLWLWFVLGEVLLYANYWDWSGDWFWGPRYMLMASLPASLLLGTALEPSAGWRHRPLLYAALAWSVWVGAEGAVFGPLDTAMYQMTANLFWYVPQYCVLFRPFFATLNIDGTDRLVLGYFVVVFLTLILGSGIDLARRDLHDRHQ